MAEIEQVLLAELTAAQKLAIRADFTGNKSSSRESLAALTKPDIDAAIDAIARFLFTNSDKLKETVPEPARSNLSEGQLFEILEAAAAAIKEVSKDGNR